MCRLFGMHAGQSPAKASFWLLQASNSLERQSHYEPDGTGIGIFETNGAPFISKQPMSAWKDRDFAFQAKHLESTTFVAHVRYASTGGHAMENTHPFVQDRRIFARNGVIGRLATLDSKLRDLDVADLVEGQTDSERIFALITAEIRQAKGDVALGIANAVNWMAQKVPIYSLNFVLSTATDMWALRYPETHELFVLDRQASTAEHHTNLIAHSGRIRTRSAELGHRHVVLIATEKMSDDSRWRLLEPGELLHIDSTLQVHSTYPALQRPERLLTLEDLSDVEAASQHPQRLRNS